MFFGKKSFVKKNSLSGLEGEDDAGRGVAREPELAMEVGLPDGNRRA